MTGTDLLERLGWDAERQVEFGPLEAEGLVPGRVSLEHNHVYRVLTAAGERLAETAGRLKHRAEGRHELPVVGDWVVLRPDPAGSRSLIREILPRRSSFSRKAAGRETVEQVVAANIDVVLTVFGLDAGVNARAIERYLVVARKSGATPVVVLNKADVSDDVAGDVAEATAAAGDTPILAVSSRSGIGLDAIARRLEPGRTLALFGPSGAGKSTLVNHLMGREVLPTGEVRDWDARGRHTSVHRQLVMRHDGGLIIDTPGMRELALWDVDELDESFADIAELADSCRFRDCRHDREPGCAVKAAVDAGTLDAGRYANFVKLQKEQTALERKQDQRAQDSFKRAGKQAEKSYRALQKQRGKV